MFEFIYGLNLNTTINYVVYDPLHFNTKKGIMKTFAQYCFKTC